VRVESCASAQMWSESYLMEIQARSHHSGNYSGTL